MTLSLHHFMDIAADIARNAGKLVVDGQHEAQRHRPPHFAALDVAMATDKATEEFIVSRILSTFPDDGIVGEEGTSRHGTTGRRWIIDPIDGTANFVRDASISAISLGIEIDGKPTVGVVFNPFHDELYKAATGMGAFLNDARLAIRLEDVLPTRAIVGLGGGNRERARLIRAEVARHVIQQAGDLRYSGSTALDLCHVASGQLDAVFACGTSLWDIAAGIVIARETGCVCEGREHESDPTADFTLASAVSYAGDFRAIVQAAVDAQSTSATAGFGNEYSRSWPSRHNDW